MTWRRRKASSCWDSRTADWEPQRILGLYELTECESSNMGHLPALIPRFMITTCLLFQTFKTGIPAIDDPGSRAIGLTVSLAPMTKTTSVSEKSSLISSISSTTTCAVSHHLRGQADITGAYRHMVHQLQPRARYTGMHQSGAKRGCSNMIGLPDQAYVRRLDECQIDN